MAGTRSASLETESTNDTTRRQGTQTKTKMADQNERIIYEKWQPHKISTETIL